jgi:hypothetical protein
LRLGLASGGRRLPPLFVVRVSPPNLGVSSAAFILVNPRDHLKVVAKGGKPTLLASCGIAGFRFGSACRFKAKNGFAFFHEIETIARNRFQISHVGLEQIDLTSLTGKQILLFVYLLLLVVDLRAALHQFFIRRNEQAYDNQPDRKDKQDAKNSVKALPDCSFTTCAKISVALIHLANCSAVHGFVTKFFFDSQELIVLSDPIAAAKRPSFDLTSIGRDRDVGNGCVLCFA